ncbi:MAG: TolC family protein [Roseibacillus sp.]
MQSVPNLFLFKNQFYAANVLGCALAMVVLTGCQSYQSQPLDLASHAESWRARSSSNEDVRSFARKLSKGSSRGGKFDSGNGLSLAEGETVALLYHPDLRLARAHAGVALATAEHAGLWDDPQLGFDVLRVTESVPSPWLLSSSLSLTLPVSGRLEVERSRAKAVSQAELAKIAETEQKVLHDLREEWLRWTAVGLELEETKGLMAQLEPIVVGTSKLAEVGEMPQTESKLFHIEQEQRRGELARLQGELEESGQNLRALMGLSPGAQVELVPSASFEDSCESGKPSDSHPTMLRLSAEYEVAEKTLLREIRKQYPDLTIGPALEREEGQSRIGLLSGIPVPILNSNKGGIATARAERELARAAYETGYERMVGRLASLNAKARGIKARRSNLEQTLVPLVDRQIGDAWNLVALGEGSSLVLLESLVRAHEVKLDLISIHRDLAQVQTEYRLLQGL